MHRTEDTLGLSQLYPLANGLSLPIVGPFRSFHAYLCYFFRSILCASLNIVHGSDRVHIGAIYSWSPYESIYYDRVIWRWNVLICLKWVALNETVIVDRLAIPGGQAPQSVSGWIRNLKCVDVT